MLGINPKYLNRIEDAKKQLEMFLASTNPHLDDLQIDYLSRAKNLIIEVLDMSISDVHSKVSNRGD